MRYVQAAMTLALALGACDRAPDHAAPAESSPPRRSAALPPQPVSCRFVQITEEAGIDFRHITGGYGEKLLPETMGAGGAFLDYDGDGALDIFLVNGISLADESFLRVQRAPPRALSRCRLFRGRGNGTFEDMTEAAGCDLSLYAMGCAAADYDGDGDEDLYITAVGDNLLLRNDGGVFHDVTELARVGGGTWTASDGTTHPEWSTAAAWLDANRDGWLDLLVANYVKWSPSHEVFTTLDGIHKAFTTPGRYPGLPPRLFLNRGDGTFSDASDRAGLLGLAGKALGLALWDFDGNGLLDVAVANDTRPNFLLMNRGEAVFDELGLRSGIAYDENGRARAGMGIDIADYANDGVPGVAIGNFGHESMSLYRWRPGGTFESVASRAALAGPTFTPLAFGVVFADMDLDGVQDLLVANGHIEPDIARTHPGESHAQSAQLFRGRGDGSFDHVTGEVGPDFRRPRVSRGLAVGDIDSDGDLDVLITVNGGTPALLRNDLDGGPHFLRVRLRDRGGNRAALGASVRLRAGGITQSRLVRTGSSYLSQSELTLTFGLGRAERIEALQVRWPDGSVEERPVDAVDRTVEIAR